MRRTKKKYMLSKRFFKFIIFMLCMSLAVVCLVLVLNSEDVQAFLASLETPATTVFVTDEPDTLSVTQSPAPAPTPTQYPEPEGFLVLVNWDYPTTDERPDGLVPLPQVFGDEVKLANPDGSVNLYAGQAASEMFKAARQEGLSRCKITSAYRSVSYQETLFNRHLRKDPNYGSNPFISPVKVMPGYKSEHSTGLALDILREDSLEDDVEFANTPEGMWLRDHAHEYGFILRYPADKQHITGVVFEPWHFRYVGVEHATKIYESKLCLEEYLGCLPVR